jgi:hypothetical protein
MSVAGAKRSCASSNSSWPNGFSPCAPTGSTGSSVTRTRKSANSGSACRRCLASSAVSPASGIEPSSGSSRMPHLSNCSGLRRRIRARSSSSRCSSATVRTIALPVPAVMACCGGGDGVARLVSVPGVRAGAVETS